MRYILQDFTVQSRAFLVLSNNTLVYVYINVCMCVYVRMYVRTVSVNVRFLFHFTIE
jgi:hypothetical protein